MTDTPRWKDQLDPRTDPSLVEELDGFELQIELKKQGRVDDALFAETRLRRGAYGQRYDNGQRHDGVTARTLEYPCGDLTKGPNTVWDAPGMLRIKIPYGAMTAEQLEVHADLAEEYSDGICHVTTRQDIQLHFVHIEDTPDLMRRLAAVGITTREACGNSVRNVTGCPISGVCHDEVFDTTPYADALMRFLLGHRDCQDFGRKFKISFSGCAQNACALAKMHDLGLIAKTRTSEDGTLERGFEMWVGGGLGAVPNQAKLLAAFVTEGELLPMAQAICRVFARLGEKRNRARARVKFLVNKLGIEEFTRLVREERAILPHDDRWTAYLTDLEVGTDRPSRPASQLPSADGGPYPDGFEAWRASNVASQRQPGWSVVTVALPLGDATSRQVRALADTARTYNGGKVRLTVEQNVVLRWIPDGDLVKVWRELDAAGLAQPGAGTLVDITSCPGTDTCKLGISASRGLAAELRRRVAEQGVLADAAVRNLRIKVSGCFNSCGQHHVADIGFYGVSRKHDSRTVPHFQVVLGGMWQQNAGAYGLAVVPVPSKRIPDVVERITGAYVEGREDGESFQEFVRRIGKAKVRALLEDLTSLPSYAEQPGLFSDWGDPREYTIGDIGVGECAGEVVSLVQFGLHQAERRVFEAQIHLDEGRHEEAAERAYRSMLDAALALVRHQELDVPDQPDVLVEEFRTRFYDTKLFFDPFAGGKFGEYLFAAHQQAGTPRDADAARRLLEEAQLFVEAAYSCWNRLETPAAVGA